jgi:hypothetical protein
LIAGSANLIGAIWSKNAELGQPIARTQANEHTKGSILCDCRKLLQGKAIVAALTLRLPFVVCGLTWPNQVDVIDAEGYG